MTAVSSWQSALPGLFCGRRLPLRLLLVAGLGASVVVHLGMAADGTHGTVMSVLMLVMALTCLSCLTGLLRSVSAQSTATTTMVMAALMALVHVLILPLMSGGTHAHHGSPARPFAPAGGGLAAMVLVAVLELAVAGLASAWLRGARRRRVALSPGHRPRTVGPGLPRPRHAPVHRHAHTTA
ncbi:hypothetical protein EAE32_00835 [Kocuria tytonicola]|uniref:Uncharacterized protein n=1 Tax=Kocuria tytonicola TaxID=2055946 RepID=A0A3L9L9S1_9MICC|nr:hypothetical protein [Kocuria tytonicola]RLY93827.1 hypothetical protein EAE32_00835 [Kocuria tytonicola]